MKNLFYILLFLCLYLKGICQCYPERHSTNWFDAWISCENYPSPHVENGNSHWILYDLGQNYKVFKTRIWNNNNPSHLDWGMKELLIEYSLDGINWMQLGEFELKRAPGNNRYEGEDGPDFSGLTARYILITALSNWGNNQCFSLSEVTFEVEEGDISTSVNEYGNSNSCFSVQVYPNPFLENSRIMVQSTCNANFQYAIVDIFGRVFDQGERFGAGIHQIDVNDERMPAGTYIVNLKQGDQSSQVQLLKVN